MRFLMLFVIGFVAGCSADIWIFNGPWVLLLAAVCFALWLILRLFNDLKLTLKALAVLCLGVAVGSFWIFLYDIFYIQPARELGGTTRTVSIEATDYSSLNTKGTGGKGKLIIDGKSYKVYYYLSDTYKLKPGDKVKGDFSFSFTGYDGKGDPTYHQGNGIFLIAYANDATQRYCVDQVPARYFPVLLRKNIIAKINSIFPEDVSGFARSLLLGDTGNLSKADDAALKVSGIRHVVAVSGLHISILMSFVFILLRDRRIINSLVSIPLLLLFCALAGFTPSVVRACVMQIVFIIGMEIEKEYDAPTSLSVAVLILVVVNPFVLTSVSFQLSVSCVIGILLFSGKIHDFFLRFKPFQVKGKSLKSRIIRTAIQSVSVTLSTMATTLPISAYYFGAVSLVSVLSNFLLLWLVSVCFYGIAISCLMGFLIPIVGTIMASVISWGIRYILFSAKWLSRIPFASVSVSNIYVFLWLIVVYTLFVVFLLIKKRNTVLFCAMALLSLGLSLTLAYTEPRMDNFRVTVLDVGQGQCILIQSKNSCYMVDCGGLSDYAIADLAAHTLRTSGFTKIDGLILTHFDYDHAGNAEAFMNQIDTEHIYVPAADTKNEIRKNLMYTYSDILCKVRETTALNCGEGQITIYPGQPGKDGNESSLCILFQAKECDILITGDRNSAGERYLIDNAELPLIDVLVAGHHGAKSSTSLYLMQRLKPRTVVISVGEDNRYGHPDPVIIKRLEMFNCIIWRTDQDGTVVLRG